MPTQTGSLDLKSTKGAYDDGSKTATNYITFISDDDGITVHNAGDTTNYTQLNAEGMTVYQNGNDVAAFGPIARIGNEDTGSIVVSDSSIVGRGAEGAEFFSFTNSGAQITSTQTFVRAPKTISMDSLTVSPPSSGKPGYIQYSAMESAARILVTIRIISTQGKTVLNSSIEFVGGTGATKSKQHNGRTYYFKYDGTSLLQVYVSGGDSTISSIQVGIWAYVISSHDAPGYSIGSGNTVTGGFGLAAGNENTASGNYSVALNHGTKAVGEGQTVIGKYNEVLSGGVLFVVGDGTSDTSRSNAFWVTSGGIVIIGMEAINGSSTSDATSGTDMNLHNAIRALGWYNDVIF